MQFFRLTLPSLLALTLALPCSPASAAHKTSGHKAAHARTAAKHMSHTAAKKERKKRPDRTWTARATPAPEAGLPGIEQQVLDLPPAERGRTLTMMLMLSSLAPAMLMEDDAATGRQAANYGSGIALERLQAILAKAKLPAAADCVGRFAAVRKDPARNLAVSFPQGCSGLKELQKMDTGVTTPKLEDLATRWATGAVQQGLAQAKQAGLAFKARSTPVRLEDLRYD
jgi:hypothetical protein